jgi:hypothetical protein
MTREKKQINFGLSDFIHMDEYSKDAGSMCSHSFQGSWQFG